MVSRLLLDIDKLNYLSNSNYYEYGYFIFYYILSWHIFEFKTIIGSEYSVSFWKNLEDQFVRLINNEYNEYNEYNHMNLSNDAFNTYSYSFNISNDLSLNYVEIDMNNPDNNNSYSYSYSSLYELSKQHTSPIVFRSLISMDSNKKNNLLFHLLEKYGNHSVPVSPGYNTTQRTAVNGEGGPAQEYVDYPDIKLSDLYSVKNNYTTRDVIKFWQVCDGFNNFDLYNYLSLDTLQLPFNDIGGIGIFSTNLPPKETINNTTDEWYLTSDWHTDSGPSFFVLLKGRKLWRLIDVKYTHLVRPDWFSSYGRLFGYKSNHFNLIPRYELILNEGDVLYFPPWWWHEIYVDHNYGFEFSASIKMTLGDFKECIKTSALFTTNLISSVINHKLFYNTTNKYCS